jgi:hypothetical protein
MGHYFAIGSEQNGLGGYFQQKKFIFMSAIDHAPQIFLRAFSGAGTIAPAS